MTKFRHPFGRTALVLALVAPLTLSASAFAAETTYEIDRAHSSIVFKVRHLLSKVPGRFKKFSGTIVVDPDKRDTVNATASIEVASIDTDEAKRDDHLKSPDFFDVAKFPTITFKGSKLTDVNSDHTKGKLAGELTIRDVTKPVVLDVTNVTPPTKDPGGNTRIGAQATTKINRQDFGIVFNKTLDGGGVLVGDEISITIDVEVIKKGA